MRLKTIICILLLQIPLLHLFAQLPMGGWRTHFAYSNVYEVQSTHDKIYGTSDGALFSVTPDEGLVEYYSVLTGLNEASISRRARDEESGNLIIVYINGNIDILQKDGDIINIPDLRNKPIPFSKSAHDIKISGRNAYISTDFGIVVLNLQRNEIAETYYISPQGLETAVYSTAIVGDSLYAATRDGLRVAPLNSYNLMDYETWHNVDNRMNDGTLLTGTFKHVIGFKGTLFALVDDHIYSRGSDNLWRAHIKDYGVYGFTATNERLLLAVGNTFYVSTTDGVNFVDTQVHPHANINAITEHGGKLWFASGEYGMSCFDGSECLFYKPDGPAHNTSYRLKFANGKLFSLPGGREGVQFMRPGHVMMFENEQWTNITQRQISDITQKQVTDFMDVAVDNNDNSHFLVTSYGTGVYEFRDNKYYKHYGVDNSPLVCPNEYPDRYLRLDGGMTDNDGNFWIVNPHTPNVIQILKTDGTWATLRYPSFDINTIASGIIAYSRDTNLKIFVSAYLSTAVIFWYDNGTPFDGSDDKVNVISRPVDQDGNTLELDYISNPVEDMNGDIWVGTNKGPLIFPNPLQAFNNSDYRCRRIKISRDDGTNLADYLLENEQVNHIAVDGANRKWLATETSGAYLVSEGGQETIEHFTSSNSPILSDNIMSVAINPQNGEVFFGTGNGLISYQGNATQPHDDYSQMHVYPNPVRENFGGVITIAGLMEASTVKIANMAGEVVCDTQSNGGTAIWDGRTKQGKKVSSGIYWVIALNDDGSERGRTRLLIIK